MTKTEPLPSTFPSESRSKRDVSCACNRLPPPAAAPMIDGHRVQLELPRVGLADECIDISRHVLMDDRTILFETSRASLSHILLTRGA